MTETVKSFCRNCGALCSMQLTLEERRIIAAAPDPDSQSPYGSYLCPKGRASAEFHNGAENRLFGARKRDADGNFADIAAAQAIDEIAAKLQDLIARYGPRSIAVFHGTGAYRSVLGGLLERAFVAAIDTPNFFSTMTIDQSAKWVTMGRMGVMASGKPSTKDIDLAVIAGNNPLVSHQTFPFAAGESGAPGRAFAELRARGGKIIVIDPRRTETARFANLLIQPLPGHDAALFAAIAHILLRDGTYNKQFCNRFVAQLDELRAAVAPFTPELVAARADVPVAQIETAAQWIGEANKAFIGSGSGPSMSRHSNLNDHMIETVNALVGGYRRAGDLVRNPGTLKPRKAYEMAVAPTRSWEHEPKLSTEDIGLLFGEFPAALLPREILTPGPNQIRALINFGGNPLMALGDPTRAIPAFEHLELLVSLDPRMNETARLSHYAIGSTQPFERHDISIPGDALFPEPFAQYAPPILPKPPGTIHDWEFFWGLAARMGLPLKLKYWTYGLSYNDIEGGMELSTDVNTPPDPEEMVRFLCADSRVSFEALKARPNGVRPDVEPSYVKPGPENGARLELCPPDVAEELAALVDEEEGAGFAFRLTCRRMMEAMNSAYRDSDVARRKHKVNWAYMNPEDMQALGISDDDVIEISSEHGVIKGVAKAEDRLRRGVVSMTHMFGAMLGESDPRQAGGSYTGKLTSLEKYLEPINYMPLYSGVPINVRPA